MLTTVPSDTDRARRPFLIFMPSSTSRVAWMRVPSAWSDMVMYMLSEPFHFWNMRYDSPVPFHMRARYSVLAGPPSRTGSQPSSVPSLSASASAS